MNELKKDQSFLIFGGTGLVGSALVEDLRKNNFEVLAPDRGTVDLANLANLDGFLRGISRRPRRVIYAAGLVNVDKAQELANLAWTLNARVVGRLVDYCKNVGSSFYYYSTDYVFDGEKSDAPYKELDIANPVIGGVYGESKREGEQRALSYLESTVIRVMLPYRSEFSKKGDLPRNLIKIVQSGNTWRATTDQMINPVTVDQIVEGTKAIIGADALGIYHLAATDFTTPYQFSLKVARQLGLNLGLIEPVSFADFAQTRLAPRPQHSWLDTTKFRQAIDKNILKSVDQGILEFVEEFKNK